jgi:hypothetical protein
LFFRLPSVLLHRVRGLSPYGRPAWSVQGILVDQVVDRFLTAFTGAVEDILSSAEEWLVRALFNRARAGALICRTGDPGISLSADPLQQAAATAAVDDRLP